MTEEEEYKEFSEEHDRLSEILREWGSCEETADANKALIAKLREEGVSGIFDDDAREAFNTRTGTDHDIILQMKAGYVQCFKYKELKVPC